VDIVKAKKRQSILSNKIVLGLLVITVFIILLSYAKASFNSVNLARKDLLIATVKQGSIDVSVEGYGILTSDKLQLITTYTRATVKEILLKPGAIVNKNSLIIRLSNPELQKQLESVQYSLAEEKANLRQLKLNHQRELLTEKANFSEIISQHKAAKLKLAAQEKLLKSGIVKQLDYQENLLFEAQLKERIAIFKEINQALILVHQEAINIQLERVKQRQNQVDIAQERLDKLNVVAGFDGVLQKLSVTLGQSLVPGQEVALIGSVTDLIALIRVPQNQAQKVLIGQKVAVDTRLDTIIGAVSRIDPIVEQNTVEVEIELPAKLPKSARPQQNIDAIITIKTLHNINYIERPANIKAQSTIDIYQLNQTSDHADKVQLAIGEKTGRYIEIISGAKQGDRFIISDLSNYQVKKIAIN